MVNLAGTLAERTRTHRSTASKGSPETVQPRPRHSRCKLEVVEANKKPDR